MEAAIQSLVKVYLKSSKGKENLRKKDFQNLVTGQLSNILSGTDSKKAINDMADGLDENQDGKLGFPEYMKLIGYLATSLSEQQGLANEEPNQNATGQVAQSSPDKEEKAEATEANAEVKAKPEDEPKDEPKAEAEPKAELSEVVAAAAAEVPAVALSVEPPKVEVGAEVKAEAEGPKGETTETVVTTTTVSTVVNEVVNGVSDFSKVTKVTEVKEVDGEVEVKEEVKVETVKAEEAPAAEEKKEETAS